MVLGSLQRFAGGVKLDSAEGLGTALALHFAQSKTQFPDTGSAQKTCAMLLSQGTERILDAEDDPPMRDTLVNIPEDTGTLQLRHRTPLGH